MLAKIYNFLRKRPSEEQHYLATGAALWLNDESLNVALATLREATHTSWLRSKDPEARERAWVTMHLIDKFVTALTLQVDSVKFEKKPDDDPEDL